MSVNVVKNIFISFIYLLLPLYLRFKKFDSVQSEVCPAANRDHLKG